MSDIEVKTCADCKYFKGPQDYYHMQQVRQEPQCEHPKAVSRELIYGMAICRTERNTKKGCGPQGKLWVSKKNASES